MASLLPSALPAASPASAPDILRRLDGYARQMQTPAGSKAYATFNGLIAQAYKVRPADLDVLQDNLSVALVVFPRGKAPAAVMTFPRQQQPLPAASSIKVVLAAMAGLEAEQQPDPGWKAQLDKGTLGGAVRSMISVSNNAAANSLLRRYGRDKVNAWLARLGLEADELHFEREFGDLGHVPLARDNRCTALGLAKFYCLLAQAVDIDGLGSASTLLKLRLLLDSQGDCNNHAEYNDRLNGRLPRGVHFVHKTGSNEDVLADGGVVYDNQGQPRLALVVLDRTKNKRAIQALGLAAYQQWLTP
jgi:beta-lactamase class A